MMAGPPSPKSLLPKNKTGGVVLEGFDATAKIAVIKVVRAATGASLGDAKGMVEGAPKAIKTGLPKDEADKLKKELEEAGGKVSIK